jgi:MFS family permease
MNRKFSIADLRGSFWSRVMLVSVMLFFVYLGDAILSDWVPAYIQDSVGSSLLMGLIISFSSVVGFGADLIFPQLLKDLKTKKLMLMAIGTSLIFCGILLWTVSWPWLILFLVGMAVWGIYYEFLGFGGQQFVCESVPAASRSGVWAIMGIFKSLAYFLGPIIGSYLALVKGNNAVVLVAAGAVLVGYLVWLSIGRTKSKNVVNEPYEKVNILDEMKHWKTLFVHVWPVLTISLVMGMVDATFWTTGTVLSDNMASENWWGGMFLPFYMLPMIFVGVIVARWGIYKGKKKMAEIFMLVSGLLLAVLGASNSVIIALTTSFMVGTALSIAWPLTEAVYSDIISRMGREGKHMVGLSGSTLSLAYIVGPVLAGYIAGQVGEKMTFTVMGIFMAVVAFVLLLVTPRKLKLPQTEIASWD